jgi:hypothetical protein
MSPVMTSLAGSYKTVFRDRSPFHSHSRQLNWYSGVSGILSLLASRNKALTNTVRRQSSHAVKVKTDVMTCL